MVRSGYDAVAESYARLLPDASFEPPADQRMIEAFVALPSDLPRIFAEFFRVLVPGGYALLSFQVGDGPRHLSHAYGHDVSMEAQLFTPEFVTENLTMSGFNLVAQMTREPESRERVPQAVLLAQRPASDRSANERS
jgi:hypothetical protein